MDPETGGSHKYGRMRAAMKTTLEVPDALFRRAKSAAAERGIPLRQLVSEALSEKLAVGGTGESPWMASFGKLRPLRRESARIDRVVSGEFEQIEPEDRE
jgi:hypothetical protein